MSDLVLNRQRLVPVLLVDGPCAGTWTHVAAWGQECWQRIGKPLPSRAGSDVQVWARYDHSPARQGEYLYSGICCTTDELGRGIAAHKRAGHTFGESEGA